MVNALVERGSGDTGLIDEDLPGRDALQGEDLVLIPGIRIQHGADRGLILGLDDQQGALRIEQWSPHHDRAAGDMMIDVGSMIIPEWLGPGISRQIALRTSTGQHDVRLHAAIIREERRRCRTLVSITPIAEQRHYRAGSAGLTTQRA